MEGSIIPINYEDVVIRILTNSTEALKGIKQVDSAIDGMGKKATISAKSIATMAASFGGVNLAIDLAVKAIGTYIKKIKESEQAYIKQAKASGDALGSEIEAYDKLIAAKEAEALIDGENTAKSLESWRKRRAARIEESNLIQKMSDDAYDAWSRQIVGAQAMGIEYEKNIDAAKRYNEEQKELLRITDSWLSKAKGQADADARGQQILDDRAAAAKKYADTNERTLVQLRNIAFLSASIGASEQQLLNLNRAKDLAAINTGYADQNKALAEAVNNYYDLLDVELSESELMRQKIALLEAEEEARKRLAIAQANTAEYFKKLAEEQAQSEQDRIDALEAYRLKAISVASDVLNSFSAMIGAIGSLIDNRYQAEIDAAEDGSAKQKQLMRKQFNAEKAMAITQSLIATAVGITKAIPNIPLMIFSAVQGAIQTAAIAATRPPQFAVGTSPSGYTVPQGHPGDTYPVMARSGEKVSIQTPASPGEAPAQINLVVDGRVFGSVMTNMFGNRYATVPAGVITR